MGNSVSGGFADPVSFSVVGLPAGVTASFSPATITGAGSSVMTLTASTTALSGNYKPVVLASDTADPTISRALGFVLTIQPLSHRPTAYSGLNIAPDSFILNGVHCQ